MKIFGKHFATAVALAGVMATLGSNVAHASCTSIGCTATIKQLVVNATGNVLIDMEGTDSPGNCTLSGGKYIEMALSNDNRKALYSMLLASYLAAKTVAIRTVDGTGTCTVLWGAAPN